MVDVDRGVMVKEKKSGLAWHMFHNHLLSWCWDFDGRVEAMECEKPAYQMPTRRKRFKFVEGTLPSAFDGARDDYMITRLINRHMDAVVKLHAKECPNCSWNGKELVFPRRWLWRAWHWLWTKAEDLFNPWHD